MSTFCDPSIEVFCWYSTDPVAVEIETGCELQPVSAAKVAAIPNTFLSFMVSPGGLIRQSFGLLSIRDRGHEEVGDLTQRGEEAAFTDDTLDRGDSVGRKRIRISQRQCP